MALQINVVGENAGDACVAKGRGLGQAALPFSRRQLALADPHQGEKLRSRGGSQTADRPAKRRHGGIIGGQDVKSTRSYSIVFALGGLRFAHGLVGDAMKHPIARVARCFCELSDEMRLPRREILQHDASFRDETETWALNANSP
jgi:hypothetical protein